ncbi:hypothetical protein KCU65_g24, partial [Aureobasidium melanogenum]
MLVGAFSSYDTLWQHSILRTTSDASASAMLIRFCGLGLSILKTNRSKESLFRSHLFHPLSHDFRRDVRLRTKDGWLRIPNAINLESLDVHSYAEAGMRTTEDLAQSKVDDLDTSVSCKHNVLGLQVAVSYSVVVKVIDTTRPNSSPW